MPDNDTFYDIFIIYDPSDIRFVRRVDGHMKANGLRCWVTWDDLSTTVDGRAILQSGILRSHTVAIALSPNAAANPSCNELIQYAVNNSKRFVTLIVDENIEIDVHPAIAKNPYIFFRQQDELEDGIDELLELMRVDPHIELHTELLVYASDWASRGRTQGLLLPLDQVDEARQWLTDGTNRQPKPSQLLVEYIHASRRQKSNRRWGLSIYLVMGLVILVLIGLVMSLLQSAQDSQSLADSRSTEVAVQVITSDANAQLAESVAGSATAEAVIIEDFAQTATSALALADMAVNSASTADAMQQTAQAQSDDAINQASTALTAQAEAENLLIIAETESETSSTLAAQVLTAEFESAQLVGTAQAAQAMSLIMAQTATFVQVSADEQANIAATQVANLATVEADATLQLATGTAVQFESESNASTAEAFAQIAETEFNGRTTAEAELQALNDTATLTFETAQEVNSQALILGAEQALNNGDVDQALALAMAVGEFDDQSGRVYSILSRASNLSPSLIMTDIAQVAYHPTTDEFAIIPQTFDRVLIYDAQTRALKFELTEHEEPITTLSYSLDGRFLVTASQDGTIIIWSSSSGAPLHRVNRHQGIVNAIAMHPDGQRMITAGIRPMLVLWDITTGDELANYMAPQGESLLPDDLLFSADGSRLIGWSNPRGETVMSQWAGETLDLLTIDSGGRVYVGYDPAGRFAFTGGRALPAYANDPNVGELVLWDIASGQQRLRLTDGFNWTLLSGTSIAASTDSLIFATFHGEQILLGVQSSDGGQRLVLVNLADGAILRTYQSTLSTQIISADFLDDDTLLSTTRDNHLVVWSLTDGTLLRDVGQSTHILRQVNGNPNSGFALVQANGGTAYLWSISGTSQAQSQVIPDAITGSAINQTGDRILIASDTGIALQNTETQQSVMSLDTQGITRMNESGTHLATIINPQVVVYDARTGIEQASWSLPDGDILDMRISSTGKEVLMRTASDTLLLARQNSPFALEIEIGTVSPAFDMQFNNDGSAFMTLHAESAILWDTATITQTQQFPLGLPPDSSLAERVKVAFEDDNRIWFFVQLDNNIAGLSGFDLNSSDVIRQTYVDVARGQLTSDGNYLLLALTDHSLQIINTESGEIVRRLVGHTDAIQMMLYQADNNRLFSASRDHVLFVWDIEQGIAAHQFQHPADVLSMTVSEDGDRVVSQAADGMYRLWQPETLAQLVDRINTTFTVRDLTCTEREQYRVLPLCDG